MLTTPTRLRWIVIAIAASARPAFGQSCPEVHPPLPLNGNAMTDAGDDYFPATATDGVGRWIAVWDSSDDLEGAIGVDRDILFCASSDNGATWSAPAALNTNAETDSGGDVRAQIATDGTGHWLAAWQSADDLDGTVGTDRDILYAVSSDDGVTWTSPAPLHTHALVDDGWDENVQITTDAAGHWLAVWESRVDVDGTIGTDRDILHAASTDHGTTWTPAAALNSNAPDDSGWDYFPQITTDGAGTWLAIWHSGDDLGGTIGTDDDILFARSTDNGASWTPPAPLNGDADTDDATDETPQLATDGRGTWIAVWETAAEIVYAVSDDDGAAWTTPAAVDAGATGFDSLPQVATDTQGNWVAVWLLFDVGGTYGADGDIVYSISDDAGDTWSVIQPVNLDALGDDNDDATPRLTGDGAGGWLASWRSDNTLGGSVGEDRDILYTRFELPDCNGNGVNDTQDIASGASPDDDRNGVPDECEVDSDEDGVFDGCDNCDLFNPDQADCQSNGVGDVCDLAEGTSADCDRNGIPDECQFDCNGDGIPNVCQTACASYTVTHLGLLSGATSMSAEAINEAGQIVGNATGGASRGFVWDSDVLSELPPVAPATDSFANDVNNAGTVIGSSRGYFLSAAITWQDVGGTWQGTPVPGTSQTAIGVAINDLGHVAGSDADDFCPNADDKAWRLPGPALERLVPDAETVLHAMNELGQAVGNAEVDAGSCWDQSHAVLWRDTGEIVDLGTLGGEHATAEDVNGDGVVVGWSRVLDGPFVNNAFLWRPESVAGAAAGMINLGTCGGESSQAYGINELGLIVGRTEYPNGAGHAFLRVGNVTLDLNNLIPADSGWLLTRAADINEAGQIVGTGKFDGQTRAFLLTPTATLDCNANTIPDECESDCNANGTADDCDIAGGLSADTNLNAVPDECECVGDADGNGVVDVSDLVLIIERWGSTGPGDPADLNADGTVDVSDLVAVIVDWGCAE